LGRPAVKISVAEIMRAVDEGVRMTRCAGEDAAPCIPGNRCLTHGLWDALGEQITWFLESVTLEEVVGGIAPLNLSRGQIARGQDSFKEGPSLSPLSALDQEPLRGGSAPLGGER
jgi:DNA-binding IscR family transcriptional regulator